MYIYISTYIYIYIYFQLHNRHTKHTYKRRSSCFADAYVCFTRLMFSPVVFANATYELLTTSTLKNECTRNCEHGGNPRANFFKANGANVIAFPPFPLLC